MFDKIIDGGNVNYPVVDIFPVQSYPFLEKPSITFWYIQMV